MTIMSAVIYKDGLRFERGKIAHDSDLTQLSGRLQMGELEAFQIKSIGVVLYESPHKLLPFAHSLWTTSLFELRFGPLNTIVYDGPVHRFADAINFLSLPPAEFETLELRAKADFLDRFGYQLSYPYQCEARLQVQAVLRRRMFPHETLPENAEMLVIFNGVQQTVLVEDSAA